MDADDDSDDETDSAAFCLDVDQHHFREAVERVVPRVLTFEQVFARVP